MRIKFAPTHGWLATKRKPSQQAADAERKKRGAEQYRMALLRASLKGKRR